MSAYLAYKHSVNLTKEEQEQIDEQVRKTRLEFSTGFKQGVQFSVMAYSVYTLLSVSAAHAAETNLNPKPEMAPAPKQPRPGFKPLDPVHKGTFAGAVSGICYTASQTGDFIIGFSCAMLMIVAGIIMNRD